MQGDTKNTGISTNIYVRKIAATIRVVRLVRGLAYGDLVPINARTNISAVERGKIDITVDKLIELSTPLKLDPVALLAISISLCNGETPEAAMERARVELDRFRSEGGLDLLQHRSLTTRLCSALEGSRRAPKMLRLLRSSRTQDLAEKTSWKSSGFPGLLCTGIGSHRATSIYSPFRHANMQ